MKREPLRLWAVTATVFGWGDEEPDSASAKKLLAKALRENGADVHIAPLRYGKNPGVKIIRAPKKERP